MGNVGEKFCHGCNIFVEGKSIGERDLTKEQNPPLTNINNPFFFNNKTGVTITDPKTSNDNNDSILNNFNKADSYVTTINSPVTAEEDQKKNQLYSKNDNNNLFNTNNNFENNNNNKLFNINNNFENNNNNFEINNNYNNNNYNNSNNNYNNNNFNNNVINNINNNSLNNSDEISNKLDKEKIYIENQNLNLNKEFSQIPLSEYILDLNPEQLTINLAPEENCLYIGTKLNEKKDGIGLEIFNNVNAKYFGRFQNGKRVQYGKFTINNDSQNYFFFGEISGIYAKGFGWHRDKKKFKDYEGLWDNSMKNGIGIEKYNDILEYIGTFKNGKREGIGRCKWNDNSFYEGEWKNNTYDGYGIYRFNDGSEYKGQWKKGTFNGFGEFINPDKKKYYGFFKHDKRDGFGIQIWFKEKKCFIGFWQNNTLYGYGKIIENGNNIYGFWKEGTQTKQMKKKEFNEKIQAKKMQYINYFKMDYETLFNLINGEFE